MAKQKNPSAQERFAANAEALEAEERNERNLTDQLFTDQRAYRAALLDNPNEDRGPLVQLGADRDRARERCTALKERGESLVGLVRVEQSQAIRDEFPALLEERAEIIESLDSAKEILLENMQALLANAAILRERHQASAMQRTMRGSGQSHLTYRPPRRCSSWCRRFVQNGSADGSERRTRAYRTVRVPPRSN